MIVNMNQVLKIHNMYSVVLIFFILTPLFILRFTVQRTKIGDTGRM